MRILIVEDEPLVARRVQQFCRKILGDRTEVLHIAGSFDAAATWLADSPIDVVLLDLNLAGEDGMQLLKTSVAGAFHTIIVSANTDQALRAFEYGVIDFVPKPFTIDRLAQALQRAEGTASHSPFRAQRLAVRKHGSLALIPVEDVLYVQGADKYSELVLINGRRELHDKNLERLHAVLPPDFERIHKSYLVRMSTVAKLHVLGGSQYEAELRDGQRLPVGRTYYQTLKSTCFNCAAASP